MDFYKAIFFPKTLKFEATPYWSTYFRIIHWNLMEVLIPENPISIIDCMISDHEAIFYMLCNLSPVSSFLTQVMAYTEHIKSRKQGKEPNYEWKQFLFHYVLVL